MTSISITIESTVKKHLHKIGDADPGIIIVFDITGLAEHYPNNNTIIGRNLIKNSVIEAGMTEAEEGDNFILFTGRALASGRAMDKIRSLHWTHHHPERFDVGAFYLVYPKGVNNVEFIPITHIFGYV